MEFRKITNVKELGNVMINTKISIPVDGNGQQIYWDKGIFRGLEMHEFQGFQMPVLFSRDEDDLNIVSEIRRYPSKEGNFPRKDRYGSEGFETRYHISSDKGKEINNILLSKGL